MGVIIEESKLKFGEFNEANVFNIEKLPQYGLIRPHGVACCEFILLRSDKLFLIEAKESCPHAVQSNCPAGNKPENPESVDNFIRKITKKMRHTLEFYGSVLLGRQAQDGLTDLMREKGLQVKEINPVVVVNTKGSGWKPDPELQMKLQNAFRPESRIWKLRPILIINEEQAKKKHFIV